MKPRGHGKWAWLWIAIELFVAYCFLASLLCWLDALCEVVYYLQGVHR